MPAERLTVEEGAVTVGTLLDYAFSGEAPVSLPRWPPDAFAVAALILQRSGAYDLVVSRWPPRGSELSGKRWLNFITAAGRRWREAWSSGARFPRALERRWSTIVAGRGIALMDLRGHPHLVHALIELCAAADQASAGVGIPGVEAPNQFDTFAFVRLAASSNAGSTLCDAIHASRVIVLPKLHAPRSGISLRSLSHHICACEPGEIRPVWTPAPFSPDEQTLNLLVIPWPYLVRPSQFARVPEDKLHTMPDRYGFFEFVPNGANETATTERCAHFMQLFAEATRVIGRIHGVILPELSLTATEHEILSMAVRKHHAFLLCGVFGRQDDGVGINELALDIPLLAPEFPSEAEADSVDVAIKLRQRKHHRWCLDRSQIVQYSLGGSLDATRLWWEHIALGRRELHFASMRPWLTMSALICEDLAKRDPVDEILRSVGPNLVIAILMDGPQLGVRWPARYATVLAEDPGSSILTVTSLGMARLCRAPGFSESRVIGLWRDAKFGARELELPQGAGGLALALAVERHEEWTADGRSDAGTTGYPFLAGVQPVQLAGDLL